jgi:hypothetical protein
MKTKYHKIELLLFELFLLLLLYVFVIASLTGLTNHCFGNALCSLNITWFLESLD